ncbi:MAG: hypothetical protein ACK4ND_15960 [Cytophagaceae bacterium]
MKKIILFAAFVLVAQFGFTQVDTINIDSRWNTLLDKSGSYQEYKVIKKTELTNFWKIFTDSSKYQRNLLVQERKMVADQRSMISELEKKIVDLNLKVDELNKVKDEITFLGASFNKDTYSSVLWFIILAVVIGAAVCLFLYYTSYKVAKQKVGEYDHLFNRFEEYKKSTIEKERKLKRDLQTQINTLEEYKSKNRV